MKNKAPMFIVAGIGTNVGKTVVSAILATHLQADYWKPIESGTAAESDTAAMHTLVDAERCTIHPPRYAFQAPLAPHHAARLEGRAIEACNLAKPQTERPLVVEMAGGVCVPITTQLLAVDVFAEWNVPWILVSRNYLGSINHTLLSVEALNVRSIPIAGLIFNDHPNRDSEEAILNISKLPLLGRVLAELRIDRHTIQRYATLWHSQLSIHLL